MSDSTQYQAPNLFDPSESSAFGENDYVFDRDKGKYVLGSNPSDVEAAKSLIATYNSGLELTKQWAALFESEAEDNVIRAIRARLAYGKLTFMAEVTDGHWPRMSEHVHTQISGYRTKQSAQAISKLMSLMDQQDPDRSQKALSSLLAMHDKHYGFDRKDPDSWPATVDRYGKSLEDYVNRMPYTSGYERNAGKDQVFHPDVEHIVGHGSDAASIAQGSSGASMLTGFTHPAAYQQGGPVAIAKLANLRAGSIDQECDSDGKPLPRRSRVFDGLLYPASNAAAHTLATGTHAVGLTPVPTIAFHTLNTVAQSRTQS